MTVHHQLAVELFAVLSPQLRDRGPNLRICTCSKVPSEDALSIAALPATLSTELVYSKQGVRVFCFMLSKECVHGATTEG